MAKTLTEDGAKEHDEVVDAIWEFLRLNGVLHHDVKVRGFAADAIEVSASTKALNSVVGDIMEVFGYDRFKIPVCDDSGDDDE